MFVSCHPTVPSFGPDPSKSFYFYFTKITRKTLFSQMFTIFFLQTGCSYNVVHKIPFGNNKQIKKKKSDLPILTFLGMWQETNIFLLRPYTLMKKQRDVCDRKYKIIQCFSVSKLLCLNIKNASWQNPPNATV